MVWTLRRVVGILVAIGLILVLWGRPPVVNGKQGFGGTSTTILQPHPVTIAGPFEFVRGKGAPTEESVRISTTGFEAPFILRLQNGDVNGEWRATSAWVWADGTLVLGASHFSHNILHHQADLNLRDGAILRVRIAGTPGSKLTVWIEGTPINRLERIIGTGGGVLEGQTGTPLFGLTLTFPPGAFAENTFVSISAIPNQEFNSGISNTLFAGTLAGPVFEFKTEGVLLKPATLILPFDLASASDGNVLIVTQDGTTVSLESGSQELDEESQQLSVDAALGRAALQVSHFSRRAVVTPRDIRSMEGTIVSGGCPGHERSIKQLDLQERIAGGPLRERTHALNAVVVHSTYSTVPTANINTSMSWGTAGQPAHYYIDRNGDIYRLVADEYVASHTLGTPVGGAIPYNETTIGIELLQHVDSETRQGETITDAQYVSLGSLITELRERHASDLDVLYHSDIDKDSDGEFRRRPDGEKRKIDPVGFDRDRLEAELALCDSKEWLFSGQAVIEGTITYESEDAVYTDGRVVKTGGMFTCNYAARFEFSDSRITIRRDTPSGFGSILTFDGTQFRNFVGDPATESRCPSIPQPYGVRVFLSLSGDTFEGQFSTGPASSVRVVGEFDESVALGVLTIAEDVSAFVDFFGTLLALRHQTSAQGVFFLRRSR